MQNRSFISNLTKGISTRVGSYFHNPYRKLGFGWFKLKQLKHLPSGKLRSVSFLNKPLYFIAPSEFLYGVKEIFIEEIYKQDLPPNPLVIDCGANIGLSVIYIKKNHPQARVIAFEPDDTNFNLLEKNIISFGFSNISLRKEAAWIENTELQFSSTGSMSSRIGNGGSGTKTINAIRLKDLLTEKIDFLKIDIEGAEYVVLEDIKDSLFHVANLFVEYHGSFNQTRELTNMLEWITKQGFNYYIKEAAPVYRTPFFRDRKTIYDYDVQLNIFCFRATHKGN